MTEQSKDEQIGFHKGSLSVLAKEREELLKIVSIVEQLMQMHIKGLKDLGVDLENMANQANPNVKDQNPDKKPIDEIL